MNSFDRTMTAIGHKEPDRVPLFLLLSLYGAKEMQIPIREYFSKSENVVAAQIKMMEKYSNDCIYTFAYAPVEIEAFGGEVIFVDGGPPNSGEPFIKSMEQINSLEVPRIDECECLLRVLESTKMLKAKVGNETPIIGVAISPFSLPVMQMGFENYLQMMYFHKDYFAKLMRINEEFCVAWANAQLEAGATAICYFDPLASPNIIERETYLATGFLTTQRTIGRIKGPTATHLASGIALPVVDDIIKTGSLVLGFSTNDDLVKIKEAAKGRICLLGNLNGVEMINWDSARIENEVKDIVFTAGAGGGLIISDNHGEIPWQVPERVLLEIAESVRRFGTYPLNVE
ncbi:MAG: uroporphyrinogen decarboxylase family protein [Saccharofermentanales bacterium]